MSHYKKVLHVGCSYLPYLGGGTHRLLEISSKLRQGFPVDLSIITHTPPDKKNERERIEGDKVFSSIHRKEKINSIRGVWKLFRIVHMENPDVVVLHNSRVATLYFLFVAPLIRKKILNVIEVHSIRESGKIQQYINRWIYNKSDLLVVLAEASKKYIVEQYHLKNSQVFVIRNGYKEKNINRLAHNYNPNSVTYSYVGSFHEWQGVVDLCRAVTSIDYEFWENNSIYFVGDGPCLSRCKEMVSAYSKGNLNIHFTGWLDAEQTDAVISKTDFLMAPRPSTVATETVVPLKVSDSIAFGVPLICSKVGGLLELLENRGAAIFFDKDNVDDLVRVIKNPLSKSSYDEMVFNLISERKKIKTWEGSAKDYWSLFDD